MAFNRNQCPVSLGFSLLHHPEGVEITGSVKPSRPICSEKTDVMENAGRVSNQSQGNTAPFLLRTHTKLGFTS